MKKVVRVSMEVEFFRDLSCETLVSSKFVRIDIASSAIAALRALCVSNRLPNIT